MHLTLDQGAAGCPISLSTFIVGLLLFMPIARAGESSILQSDHATLRLIAEKPNATGTFRGALVIDLDPGWKTYWIDPGEAGIPPVLDFSVSSGLTGAPTLRFPVPRRFDDGLSKTVGYEGPVAVAFEARAAGTTTPDVRLRASLGVCEEICIPLMAELDVRAGAETASDAATIEWAFAALPPNAPDADLHLSLSDTTARVDAALPPETNGEVPDIFLAGPSGWNFGAATVVNRADGTVTFSAPILARGGGGATGEPATFDAVMTAGEWALEYRGIPVDGTAQTP